MGEGVRTTASEPDVNLHRGGVFENSFKDLKITTGERDLCFSIAHISFVTCEEKSSVYPAADVSRCDQTRKILRKGKSHYLYEEAPREK